MNHSTTYVINTNLDTHFTETFLGDGHALSPEPEPEPEETRGRMKRHLDFDETSLTNMSKKQTCE